ncbi:MAG: hypothetical protein E3J64_04845 [Anaerolineales bacterium]|nr:MAG: hypothetical protein E3J64_04845 [Anaerolineales bacterium]
MSGKWIVCRIVGTLILIGVLIAGGAAVYRAGWSSGYTDAGLVEECDEVVTSPWFGHGMWRFGRGFSSLGLFFGLGLLACVAMVVSRAIWGFGWRRRRMHGPGPMGPRGMGWSKYHRHMHGPGCCEPGWDGPPADEKPEGEGAADEAGS